MSSYICHIVNQYAKQNGFEEFAAEKQRVEEQTQVQAQTQTQPQTQTQQPSPAEPAGSVNLPASLVSQMVQLLQETLNNAQKCVAYL